MPNYPGSLPALKENWTSTATTVAEQHTQKGHIEVADEVNAIGAELGTTPKAPTLATPASSATTVANLLGMILQRFKDITGLTNWYDAFTSFPVTKGGTGAVTLTGLVKGNGTSAMTAVTAPSGAVVGDTDTQSLTNKNLLSSTNSLPNQFLLVQVFN